MNLEEHVKAIIAKVLGLASDSIRLEASLKDDLGATSLDRYTILMDIEEAFHLDLDDVPEEEIEGKMQRVEDILEFLKSRGKS